jgi:hypothetical protein
MTMKDETYSFISDVKDKKITARSAKHMRTHCGKGGRVRLPSDNLSKKELQKMNGECKSYRLNSPMAWNEFKAMPDDIKITYIKLLREKFDVPDCEIYKMFGTNKDALSRYFKALGLRVPRKNSKREWKKEEWFAWVNGVDMLPAPTLEEKKQIFFGEEKGYVEDDLPFEEPEAVVEEDIPCVQLDPNRAEEVLKKIHPSLADLEAELMKAKAENEWLRNENNSLQNVLRMREAQLEIVQLIFGGRNNGN